MMKFSPVKRQGTKYRRGFTLIELLVVTVIIGMISTIAAVGYNTLRNKSRYTRIRQEFTQMVKAAEAEAAMNGRYTIDKNPGEYPGFLLMPIWSAPPCPNWNYDWENWVGFARRITIRSYTDTRPIFYLCMNDEDGQCGNTYVWGGGVSIDSIPSKSISCNE